MSDARQSDLTELSEELAEATDTTTAAIEQGAKQADPRHGDQFNPERLAEGTKDEAIRKHYALAFEPRNIAGAEPGEAFDTYEDEKALHQLVDFAGVDYLIDTFDAVYGVNHRENASGGRRRFDIRADTGTTAPSELEKARACVTDRAIGPRYASRLKRTDAGGVEWVRIVDLQPLVNAIEGGGLRPHKTWSGDGGVEAWFFNYGLLRDMGAVVYDNGGESL